MRGTQPESADRVYVVSGHYDSRCSDVLDFTCDAPGAADASGVAAVARQIRRTCMPVARNGYRSPVAFPLPQS
ncbi:MAG TPA: hypothetical protein VK510_15455 [Solirubrobacteraceae bacterium]|nr:hypothetical protein [Solirubrobacteraceae bacterium]